MEFKKFSFILFLLSLTLKQEAQFQNILIGSNNTPEEVSIAINPKNTNQIVAGANINNRYKSSDGGLTWQISTLACNAYGVYGDPVLFWDTTGACYYAHLSNPPSVTIGGSWIDRIVVQKSTDAGASYPLCIGVGKNSTKAQDKEGVVVNPKDNSIHMTWTQFDSYGSTSNLDSSIILYSKSIDGGQTFSNPKRISKFGGDCVDTDNTVEGAVPAIGPNGEVYVSWAGPNGLVFQSSLDGGVTWQNQETPIIQTPNGWDYSISGLNRCNGLPYTMCDISNSPYKGTIYVNWTDQRVSNTDTDVFIVKSTDGGATWSNAIRVNNDAPGKHQFMSTMCIDQTTGYVYVLYYDRRNHSGNDSTDVYMAVSKDGCNTFQNFKVNQRSFKPNASTFFGDYIGISAHNNVIRPIWMQLNSGQLKVYTAIIDNTLLGIKTIEDDSLKLDIEAIPNPVSDESKILFSLRNKYSLTIQIVDTNGKVVDEPYTNKVFKKGKNEFIINRNKLELTRGVYYVVFFLNQKSQYIKLLIE